MSRCVPVSKVFNISNVNYSHGRCLTCNLTIADANIVNLGYPLKTMHFAEVKDSEIEAILLQYIDEPYFKNNPNYIELWQRYYTKTNNIKVLYLMKHKKISRYYHWLYVELAQFFLKINHPGMARYILDVGIKTGAYDKNILLKELDKIPINTKKYSESEILYFLDPKGFSLLGKTWNSFEACLYYNRCKFLCDGKELSFEELRSRDYFAKSRSAQSDTNRLCHENGNPTSEQLIPGDLPEELQAETEKIAAIKLAEDSYSVPDKKEKFHQHEVGASTLAVDETDLKSNTDGSGEKLSSHTQEACSPVQSGTTTCLIENSPTKEATGSTCPSSGGIELGEQQKNIAPTPIDNHPSTEKNVTEPQGHAQAESDNVKLHSAGQREKRVASTMPDNTAEISPRDSLAVQLQRSKDLGDVQESNTTQADQMIVSDPVEDKTNTKTEKADQLLAHCTVENIPQLKTEEDHQTVHQETTQAINQDPSSNIGLSIQENHVSEIGDYPNSIGVPRKVSLTDKHQHDLAIFEDGNDTLEGIKKLKLSVSMASPKGIRIVEMKGVYPPENDDPIAEPESLAYCELENANNFPIPILTKDQSQQEMVGSTNSEEQERLSKENQPNQIAEEHISSKPAPNVGVATPEGRKPSVVSEEETILPIVSIANTQDIQEDDNSINAISEMSKTVATVNNEAFAAQALISSATELNKLPDLESKGKEKNNTDENKLELTNLPEIEGEEVLISETTQTEAKTNTISGQLKTGGELIINSYIFYIREKIGDEVYHLMRIAKIGEENKTILSKDFVLSEISRPCLHTLQEINCPYLPKYSIEQQESKIYVLHEYYELGTIKKALQRIGQVDSVVALNYLDQIFNILQWLNSKNYKFNNFTLNSACLTNECVIVITDFSISPGNIQVGIYNDIYDQLAEFADIPRVPAGLEDIPGFLKAGLNSEKLKLSMVKHKIALYESLFD